MRVAVIGQGYVGLPLSIAMASSGHTVYAVEVRQERLDALLDCQSYIVDVTDAELRTETDRGRFRPVATLDGIEPPEAFMIATPTPLAEGNRPNLEFVDTALATVARSARPGALIVLESTIYPGAMRNHVAPLFERLSGLRSGVDVHFAYSPDRVDPGRDSVLREVPKLVAGLDANATEAVRSFYETAFKSVVAVSSCEIAEFTKLFENTFRYLNIAFVNELSKAANAMDISFREVVSAAATKPFGFMPFHHGPGVGGHCLPNNVHYLNHALDAVGHRSDLLTRAVQVNDSMPGYAVARLSDAMAKRGRPLAGATVLILGLAFKSGVSDSRNSPAYTISEALVAAGAKVRVTDPWIGTDVVSDSFQAVELTEAECAAADAILLVTDHDEADYDTVLKSASLVLDCRGMLNTPEVEQL